ncbi:ATP-binding protein [Micromonospora sonchi]|uniref:ATP-binding protein n=1 Tax=Micromonospora sonchi TaxID=1763543 RepID=A0A917TMT7_9ACTN|nr:ATP/GTP-binding protein [Micromonospora sonchi]GGM28472.1 ATP-binding protein [Micromonospora sonchi]
MSAFNSDSDWAPNALKVLIAGGFGVGKTTFITATSEIPPLRTEELLTTASVGTDDLAGIAAKTTTTVALDFGRITIDRDSVLYLFGAPGQDRFWFLWDELSHGALGAVVLVDTRRLPDCFAAVDFFESRGMRFLVAVNEFDGAYRHNPEEVREALGLLPAVPIVMCDARDRRSATTVLVTLVRHLLAAPSPAHASSAPTEVGDRA